MAVPIIRVSLEGQKDIIDALKKRGKWAGDVLEDAVAAGAEVLRDGMSRRAPRGATGELSEHIISETERKGLSVQARVGPDKKHWYGMFVEFGAAAHEISPLNRKALMFDGHWAAHVTHPGVAAQPFMRPTFDEDGPEAEAAIREKLAEALGL